jgi:hypothetical protein
VRVCMCVRVYVCMCVRVCVCVCFSDLGFHLRFCVLGIVTVDTLCLCGRCVCVSVCVYVRLPCRF